MHACLLIPYVDTASLKTQDKKKERNNSARKFEPGNLKYKGRGKFDQKNKNRENKVVNEREREREEERKKERKTLDTSHTTSY